MQMKKIPNKLCYNSHVVSKLRDKKNEIYDKIHLCAMSE